MASIDNPASSVMERTDRIRRMAEQLDQSNEPIADPQTVEPPPQEFTYTAIRKFPNGSDPQEIFNFLEREHKQCGDTAAEQDLYEEVAKFINS